MASSSSSSPPRLPLPPFFCFLSCFLFCFSSSPLLLVSSLNSDASLLLQIKSTLSNGVSLPSSLATWSSTAPLCAWADVQWGFVANATLLNCSSPSLREDGSLASEAGIAAIAISLASAGLTGSVPSSLSSLASLQTLDLSGNNLTGGIPTALGQSPSLTTLKLASNDLSGAIPASLWNLCKQKESGASLQELSLGRNQFSGAIPPASSAIAACTQLSKLDLGHNLLSGSIPADLATFAPSLSELDLSGNELTGAIPESLGKLSKLSKLDLSGNNLSGAIPQELQSFGASSYAGNALLCGPPLQGAECVAMAKHLMNKRVVAALVIGAMAAAVVALAICVALGHRHNWGRDAMKRAMKRRDLLQIRGGGGGEEEDDVGEGKLIRFEGGEHLNVEEVLNAPGEVLGKTSYGTVYKAKLGGGGSSHGSSYGGAGMIALRLLREDTVKEKEEFMVGVRQIGQVRYPNIVSLLAYYAGPKGEKLLVYNYLSRGSLADLLYSNRSSSRPALSWARRHKIALGAARGLAHLHHVQRMVHGNLKSRNVMVDESFEGHLADYGLPQLMAAGPAAEMLKGAAAQGYKPPELSKMSRASPKSDVYNFGIILLEILTGKKAREEGTGPEKEAVELPVYVKQAILEERAAELFDLEILSTGGGRNAAVDEGLVHTLQLAMGCCAPSPMLRPDIKEVVRRLDDVRPKPPTPLYTPVGMKSPRDFAAAV